MSEVSNLNGAGWRLYRHINRYSQMSVLFGGNAARLATAGQAEPVANTDSLSRFEADFGWGEPDASPQATFNEPVPSPAGQPRVAQRIPIGATAPMARPINRNSPSPNSQAGNIQRQIQPVAARSIDSAQPIPTIAPHVNPVQPVNIQSNIRPVNRQTAPAPSHAPQTAVPPVVVPSHPPTIGRLIEPQQPSASPVSAAPPAPQIARVQPVVPNINRTNDAQPVSTPQVEQAASAVQSAQPIIQPAQMAQRVATPPNSADVVSPSVNRAVNTQAPSPTQPVQPAPAAEPSAPKIDRAQQERMGQMAVHNPDMVKVPKHMNSTQVWNGLSRINQFHADRQEDSDPRTPWERKTVEKKPERPKKLLRRTAIEEVGSTKKSRKKPPKINAPKAQRDSVEASKSEPARAEKPVQEMADQPEMISRETAESNRTSTSEQFDNTPSLEEVWPVQRLEEPSDFSNQDGFDSELVNLDPPSRPVVNREEQTKAAEVESVVNRVESAQQSDSSIDFVPPTRPRPQILRQPNVPQSKKASPPETNAPSDAQVQREPYGVQTEFGELPSDLWNLVGDKPPTKADSATQRVAEPENGSMAADVSSGTQPPVNQSVARAQEQVQSVEPQTQSEADQPAAEAPQAVAEPESQRLERGSLARDILEPAHQSALPTPGGDIPTQRENDPTQKPAVRASESATAVSDQMPVNRAVSASEPTNPIVASADVMRAEAEAIKSTQNFPPSTFSPTQATPLPMAQRTIESDLVGETGVNLEPPSSASEPVAQFIDGKQSPLARESVLGAESSSVESLPIQLKSEPFVRQVDPAPEPVSPPAEMAPINRVEAAPEPVSAPESTQPPELQPASFRPVMRAESDFAELYDVQTDDVGSVEEPSAEPDPIDSGAEPVAELVTGLESKGAMIFADPETAEADGGQAAPLEVSMPQLEQPATLFGDVDEVTQVAAEAEPKEAGQSVTLFGDEEQAAEKLDSPMPVSIIPEGDDAEPKQTYGDEGQVAAVTSGGDSGEKEAGLTLYPDDDAVSGSAIELKIKVSGEEDLLIGFADSNQLSQFMDVAAAADQTPGLMLFPAEDGDGEGEFDPVPFLLQRQGEQELVIGFADEATLDAFLSEASEVERGPTALIYAEQEAADEDLENPAEVHFRLAEGNDVLLGYADTEALEELIQSAEEVNPEHDLNELTQLVYGRLRHQLQVENERRGISS